MLVDFDLNLQYFNSTIMNLRIAGLVLNAKCKIVVFTDAVFRSLIAL